MVCQHIQEKIDDYIDGKLTALELHAFLEHVDTCAHCQQLLAERKRLRLLLRENKQVAETLYTSVAKPASLFKTEIWAKIDLVERERQAHRRIYPLVVLMFSLLVISTVFAPQLLINYAYGWAGILMSLGSYVYYQDEKQRMVVGHE